MCAKMSVSFLFDFAVTSYIPVTAFCLWAVSGYKLLDRFYISTNSFAASDWINIESHNNTAIKRGRNLKHNSPTPSKRCLEEPYQDSATTSAAANHINAQSRQRPGSSQDNSCRQLTSCCSRSLGETLPSTALHPS